MEWCVLKKNKRLIETTASEFDIDWEIPKWIIDINTEEPRRTPGRNKEPGIVIVRYHPRYAYRQSQNHIPEQKECAAQR